MNKIQAPRLYVKEKNLQVLFFNGTENIFIIDKTTNSAVEGLAWLFSTYFVYDIRLVKNFFYSLIIFY